MGGLIGTLVLAAAPVFGSTPASAAPTDGACPRNFELVRVRRLERLGYTFSGNADRNGNGVVCAKGDIGEEDITIIDDRG